MTTAPIHITHVIVGLDVGGAERFLHRLIEAHRGSPVFRHRVISLTSKGVLGPRLEAGGIAVTALGMRSLRDAPRTYARLERQLRAQRPDVLQCWMYYADLLGGLAGRRLGIRHILWGIRNSHFEAGGTRLKRAVRRTCAIASRHLPWRIVCVADSALEVHARAGYDRSRMEVIHNGYDPEAFTYSEPARNALRAELGIAPEDVVVGSLGRYSAAKDQHGFVRAAQAALQQRPELRFLMVGRELTRENQALSRQIAATGHPERFFLLGERSDVAACLSAMDIFCLHSRTEGFPNVLGEAMCVGLPCIATDVGDAARLLGGTGRVVPAGDTASLAQSMAGMAELDEPERRAMGREARRRIVEHFTLGHSVGRFESLYRTAMSRPS
ncbi:glycosyltransferase family 4 protein [Pusillimonas sp.]|uniref:glycosyltransferase family 4 protein n=1 Tax=Pusillimonas sp. TaxID=3040095 RepID=UPI0029BFA61B|nr:glycosyltransferase [Pusillimonas sp.]MDX3895627.1 glycosyltransferase [Pusillimonas sp.]